MSRRGGERIDYDAEVVEFCCFRCYCYCWRWVLDGPTTVRGRSWYVCFYKCNTLIPMTMFFVAVAFLFIKKEEDTFTKILEVLVVGLIAACLLWWLMNRGPLNPFKLYNQHLPRWIKGQRKRLAPHNLNLTEILISLHQKIPSEEGLKDIEANANAKLLKMCKSIEENMSFQNTQLKLVGSTAERFMRPTVLSAPAKHQYYETFHALLSDYDFMLIPDMEVSNTDSNSQYYFQMEDNNLNTGFVYVLERQSHVFFSAKDTLNKIKKIVQSLKISEFQEYDLGSPSLWECCNTNPTYRMISSSVTVSGPAVTLRLGSNFFVSANRLNADITFALKFPDWPSSISDWGYRANRKWPSHDVVLGIIKEGCHVVPKSQTNDRTGSTWRLSFSSAEVELSKLIPETARMCFLGIKVIAKDYLSITCNRIKSYHMKSILLYTLEKADPHIWSNDTCLTVAFNILIDNIKEAVENRYCPHFWIPSINLFEDLTSRESKKLLSLIERIMKSPEKFIEDLVLEQPDEEPLEEVLIVPDENIGLINYGSVTNNVGANRQ